MKSAILNLLRTAAWLIAFLFFAKNLTATNLPFGFVEVKLADGLDAVGMALAPDGRLFVLEKFGQVRIIDSTGQLLPEPFLYLPVDNFNERGLDGIAIPPDFEQNPWVYLYYTVPGANHNRVSRFRADGNFAVPGSEEILLDLDELSGPHHNAGAMLFGNDGMLYIAVGDGTDANNAQDMNSLLGKILRIRPDGSIPEDNPFYNQLEGKNRAIYALGFRNPFSMTLDPQSGRIFSGDVGGYYREEINEILPGRNYGWPLIEGKIAGQNPPDNYQDPVYAYSHANGCAIVGGAFYTPQNPMFPANYHGKYFFSDYCSGKIKTLDPATGFISTFATEANRPISLIAAPDGTMYYIARGGLAGGSAEANTASNEGAVWRIIYTGNGAPFVSVHPAPRLVSVGENVDFETLSSGTAPFQYQWQRDGQDIPGATGRTLQLFNVTLADSASLFRCIVTNSEGSDTTREAMLRVTSSQRPQPLILSPADGSRYVAGDTLFFKGMAEDNEDGLLPASALRWRLDFHHDDHTHPSIGPTPGIEEGYFVIPKVDETDPDVWFRFYLTAKDNSGLENTTIAEVFPYKSNFYLRSEPTNVPYFLEGNPKDPPLAVQSVVGLYRDIAASRHHYQNDSIYVFREFDNGSKEYHFTYEVPMHDSTFTAIYDAYPTDDGSGLLGSYYDDPGPDHIFTEPPVLTRIDSVLDFVWSGLSPAPGQMPANYYMVRWEGFIKPIFDGYHTLYLTTDDGSRMWLAGDLIFDLWYPQGPTEYSREIFLKKDLYYPVRIEYFQDAGEAALRLWWEHEFIGKSPVPQSQLFPKLPDLPGDKAFEVNLFPNPAGNLVNIETQSRQELTASWELFNTLGQLVRTGYFDMLTGASNRSIDTDNLQSGIYLLRLNAGGEEVILKLVLR